eukprot:CFRG7578T1
MTFTIIPLPECTKKPTVVSTSWNKRLSRWSMADQAKDGQKPIAVDKNKAHCQIRRDIEGNLSMERRGMWHYILWWLTPLFWNIPLLYRAIEDKDASLIVSLNFFLVIFSRNEFFVWIVYLVLVGAGKVLPSIMKKCLNRLAYNVGGLHTGSAAFLIVSLIVQIIVRFEDLATLIFSAILIVGLLVISAFACPWRHKQKNHDYFEFSHRFLGWALAAVVIAQIIWTAVETGNALWRDPSTYLLLGAVFLVAWPWLTMMRVTMEIDAASSMVTTLTTSSKPVFAGAGTAGRVSFGYASQYHSFAVLNALNGEKGVSFAVSSAGDWTRKLNLKGADPGPIYPASHPKIHTMYLRRFVAPGFMYLARTYKRVLCIGTGAGIAPISSYLPNPPNEMLIMWVGRDFEATYGKLYETIVKHKDLIMIDTTLPPSEENPYEPKKTNSAEHTVISIDVKQPEIAIKQPETALLEVNKEEKLIREGFQSSKRVTKPRPNLPLLALAAVEMYKADAVFIVSGPKPTYDLCHALWKRDIPAYGATWDS